MSFHSEADIVRQETGRLPEIFYTTTVKPPVKNSTEPPRDLWEKFFGLYQETEKLLKAVGLYRGLVDGTSTEEDHERVFETSEYYHSGSLESLEKCIDGHNNNANDIAKQISECYTAAGLHLTPAWLRMCIEKDRDGVRREIRLARAQHRFPKFENPAI